MHRSWRFKISVVLILALVLSSAQPARASIPTQTEVVLIFVGVAAVGAAIGFTAYHFSHKSQSITGCTMASGSGLTLRDASDQQSFTLTGDTSNLKPGERVRLVGKRRMKDQAGASFLVEKIGKDFGACPVTP